ncbi:hypothetical protein [Terrisporobacter mayombei]|uniref:Uncharacterized protein n=1 Tax=Terrisporobacter mayombei TaxID=1541 RepID=A0ABY9Q2J1_9FIRM|nr:hypothetical protein [Terrisporobacter mayombei]MCC3869361.1 hypothetical protein [Terrisporobacter mayombei]WMT82191.1 hypothetical protein TEMA_25490 [Terrisporobacter mayombei]
MLYTPKYIYNSDLDKKICKCSECKKYRILYCHSNMIENKKESTKEINSDIIAVCSKCGSTYRFNLKHLSNISGDNYEVGKVNFIEEKYPQIKENITKNYDSYEVVSIIKSENFLTKLIKDDREGDLKVSEYVFMEK